MALDAHIDALYALPLGEFTAARNALAKSLKGDPAASTVKSLAKPSVLAWAVNQLYWKNRPIYDRLIDAGRTLRVSQIARLEGRKHDADAALAEHTTALAAAATAAHEHAVGAGLNAPADSLGRMLEALSLAVAIPSPPGRLIDVVQPAGFEALLGLAPPPGGSQVVVRSSTGTSMSGPSRPGGASRSASQPAPASGVDSREERQDDRWRAAAARAAAEADAQQAQQALEDALKAQERAQSHVEEARARLSVAESGLHVATRAADVARRRVEKAAQALDALR